MEYIKNLSPSIPISWEIDKSFVDTKNLYKIFSVSFFKKKCPYRDFNKYKEGLNKLIENINNNYQDYILRIYHDRSVVKEIEEIKKKYPNYKIEYFKYDIPFFYDEDFHKGTIGTILRFLPLYESEIDECIVVDVDKNLKLNLKEVLNYMKKHSICFSYNSNYLYSYIHRIRNIPNALLRYSILSNCIIQLNLNKKNTPSFGVFSDFLESIFIKEDVDWLISCGLLDLFEYGIDEVIINHTYVTQLYSKETNILVMMSRGISEIIKKITLSFLENKLDSKLNNQNKTKYIDYISGRIKEAKDIVEYRILKNLLYNINQHRYKCKSIDCLLLKTKDSHIICETKITIN